MSDIKAGDLVMVVKPTPCCGNSSHIGAVFAVVNVVSTACTCGLCLRAFRDPVRITEGPNGHVLVSCLKKIDPPAEGDSLPTKADIEVAA